MQDMRPHEQHMDSRHWHGPYMHLWIYIWILKAMSIWWVPHGGMWTGLKKKSTRQSLQTRCACAVMENIGPTSQLLCISIYVSISKSTCFNTNGTGGPFSICPQSIKTIFPATLKTFFSYSEDAWRWKLIDSQTCSKFELTLSILANFFKTSCGK